MKVLTPINKVEEVEKLIEAGADEIYCGVLPVEWKKNYTNVASPNRREWTAANLASFSELGEVVKIAHTYNIPVNLTLNALYTQGQYPLLYRHIEQAKKNGIDALIIADLGLLLSLREMDLDIDIHISTGGTTFNSQTAKFYEELGTSRIILPRHLRIDEIKEIISDCPTLKFEVFILNSGCKNIDGFCTFQHGVSEILYSNLWNLPKRLNFDRYFLNIIRRLPKGLREKIKCNVFGIDSACLLNYAISFTHCSINHKISERSILKNISFGFGLLSGVDTCGVCRLAEFEKIGVYGLKIVGRNYSTPKKIKDIKFIKTILRYMKDGVSSPEELRSYVKNKFKQIYKFNCGNLCYYPFST